MNTQRDYDLVLYGASGFTGKLVAEYIAKNYGETDVRWAFAGRNAQKLSDVRDELGLPADFPLILADADDPQSLHDMVAKTRLVITTVGPYQLYGEGLLAACAKAGTDYVDLCGEPAWMRQMIDAYEQTAQQSGARIVFSCGFDSIPFDLGVLFLQSEARRQTGAPLRQVHGRVRSMKGGFSGGTAASLKATLAAAAENPDILALLRDPFALVPDFDGPKQPSGMKPLFDEQCQSWAAPFIMAPINTRNVHRSHALLGHPWGRDFTYDEMILTGPGDKGEAVAKAVAEDKSMMKEDGLKPGEGPSREERENGSYDVLFIAPTDDGQSVRVSVSGDRDPGYGSTSKMITEAALCLLHDCPDVKGGIWTPAAAMGTALIKRLEARAGLRFRVEQG
ncbi:saccharopine dehydrogenase [Iodidimonas nitroreducens]|uniref:Saccharopine dehydrogenase n=1 Tax=Iodidimonas nitroreducens TaxID=1236968 RepID=A0A5A7N940_9PROT|nr:saccharopine dehydrogenase NADP-binding domain-containing protein [Iodidimonas nitroreducens]GAK33372.1 putative trans-acting enoyl reductase [alpha proteobacterium Q-1]GER04608.1 saccharopine dehydrogenase [Iodidimonas nitroreducens]